MITDSFSYNLTPVSCCNCRKKKSKLYVSSNNSIISLLVCAKSIKMYDLNSFFANSSAIVDFPTRLAPLINRAYLSLRFSFHSSISLYIFLLKTDFGIFFHLSSISITQIPIHVNVNSTQIPIRLFLISTQIPVRFHLISTQIPVYYFSGAIILINRFLFSLNISINFIINGAH